MDNQLPLLVSFSGGRTSAFMCKYILAKYPERAKVFVFANTGKEKEETLRFVHEVDTKFKLDLVWLEARINLEGRGKNSFRIVNYETASRNGEPFENVIKKYGLPNMMNPHCTRELKERPIHKFMRSLGFETYETAIGIRYDEAHRINRDKALKHNYVYPLCDEIRATNLIIREFWKRQDFDLQLKDYEGNCDLCYKKSTRKLLTILSENPQSAKWWHEMEQKYGTANNYTFYRKNLSVFELLKMSQSDFVRAIDLMETGFQTPPLFSDMDLEYDCFCKST